MFNLQYINRGWWLGLALLLTGISGFAQKNAVKLGDGSRVQNCIVWGNTDCDVQLKAGTVLSSFVEGVSSGVPGFKDVMSGDFLLQYNSPCRNTGKAEGITLPASDLWGNPRISGASVDIGAHEYTTYRIFFRKNALVSIKEAPGSDSTGVEPGTDYKFGILTEDSWNLKNVYVNGSDEKLEPGEGGYYTLRQVKQDMTVVIVTDPPLALHALASSYGGIRMTYNGQQKQTTSDSDVKLAVHSGEEVELDTFSLKGYRCIGLWAEEEGEMPKNLLGGVKPLKYNVTKNTTLKAVFEAEQYQLTIETAGDGVLTVKDRAGKEYHSGERVSFDTVLVVTALPGTGHQFSDLKANDVSVRMGMSKRVDGPLTLKGIFTLKKYLVDWLIPANGNQLAVTFEDGTALPANKRVDYGSRIKAAWQAAEGYRLSGLKAGNQAFDIPEGGADGNCIVTIVQDTVFTASFRKRKYKVSWEATPAGNVLQVSANGKVLNSGDSVEYGFSLNILPVPVQGYECVSMTLNDDPANLWNPASLTVSVTDVRSDIRLYSEFEWETYTVIYNTPVYGKLKIEKGNGTDWTLFTASGQEYTYGQYLRVTALPDEGYRLKTLTRNDVAINTGWSEQPTGDETFYAEFEPETYTVDFQKTGNDKGYAALRIFDKLSGKLVQELPKGTDDMQLVNIPYGTNYRLEPVLDEGYIYKLTVQEQGGSNTDITSSLGYQVQKQAVITLNVMADPNYYKVTYEAVGGSIEVYKAIAGDVVSGTTVPAGTLLRIVLHPDPGYVLKTLTVNDAVRPDPVSNWTVNGEVHFKAEFAEGHRVTYGMQPEDAGQFVVRNGDRIVNSGDLVPEGTVLTVSLERTDPAYKCYMLETVMNGVHEELYNWSEEGMAVGIVRQTAAVTADMHLTAGLKKYYSFIYRKPVYGSLTVCGEETSKSIPVNKSYELPEGLLLQVKAEENVAGYHFEGVQEVLAGDLILDHSEGTGKIFTKLIAVDRNMELNAVFAVNKYKVRVECSEGGTYQVSGGTVLADGSYEVEYGESFRLTTTPLSENYRLVSFTCNGLLAEPGDVHSIQENTVFRIVYGRLYQITYQAGGTEGSLKVTDESGHIIPSGDYQPEGILLKVVTEVLQEGYRCNLLTVVDKAGDPQALYQISGDREKIFSASFDMPANDVTAMAEFEIKSCKVEYTQPQHGGLTVTRESDGTMIPANTTVPYGTVIRVTVTPDPDMYECKQSELTENANVVSLMKENTWRVTDNVSITARLDLKQWPLFIEEQGNGRLEVTDNNGKAYYSGDLVPVGTPLTIRGMAAEGYTFTVVGNGTLLATDETCLKMMPNNSFYLTAYFALKQYRVHVVHPSEGGHLVVSLPDGGDLPYGETLVDYGTILNISGIAEDGFALTDIQVNGEQILSGNSWTTKTDAIVEARFMPVYKVEYVKPEHGEMIVEADGVQIPSGSMLAAGTEITVSLTADSEAYETDFLKINGEEYTSGDPYVLTEDVVISAALSIKRYPVTYELPEHAVVEVMAGETPVESGDLVDHGTVLTVKVTTDEGWMVKEIRVEGGELTDGRIEVTDAIYIVPEIREIVAYQFPVAFTPNGDGINDTWEIQGIWACPENTLEIYNRQGKRIYRAEPYGNEWDGKTDKGDVLPAGTYVYVFKIRDGETYSGVVSIIRK